VELGVLPMPYTAVVLHWVVVWRWSGPHHRDPDSTLDYAIVWFNGADARKSM